MFKKILIIEKNLQDDIWGNGTNNRTDRTIKLVREIKAELQSKSDFDVVVKTKIAEKPCEMCQHDGHQHNKNKNSKGEFQYMPCYNCYSSILTWTKFIKR